MKYTKKIVIPEYIPKQESSPDVKELYEDSKYITLLKTIQNSQVNPSLKTFLELSCTRFIDFNYSKIAEYYAHADNKVKELMEDLLLVLVDFDKADELGVIKTKEEECQTENSLF